MDEKLRLSEVDRELERELESEDSFEDLFGDDSDADPTYIPDTDEPSCSSARPMLFGNRPSLFGNRLTRQDLSLDSDSDSDFRPLVNNQPRTVNRLNRPINRQVLSDTDEDDVDSDVSTPIDATNFDENKWDEIDESIAAITHAFEFSENPGPKNISLDASLARPVDYFNLFFTNVLLNIFVTETNRYARQVLGENGNNLSPHSRLKGWQPVTLKEIRSFIVVLLNMGLLIKPTIKSYWCTSNCQSTSWFNRMFTRSRFENILSFFHMVDNTKHPKSGEPGYDPCQKFQPLQDHCNRLFQHYYTGHQQLSVDESLIGTKNQTALMQYLPNKHHHRWGIKLWVLCDSVSKYCLSFFCYKGAKSAEDREDIKKYGLAYTVIIKLLNACHYLGKGYHVFSDNFFSSLPLVKILYSKLTFFTGTLRKNRKGIPEIIKKNLQVGEKVYCKQENTVILSYREKASQKKPVVLISSKPEVKDVTVQKKRRGRDITTTKPAIIQDYNKSMGGIDHFDMMLYQYLDERRTVKYWKKVAFNLFSRMVLNAYIIYKENCQQANIKIMSRYQFIVKIIDSIGDKWMAERQTEMLCGGGDGFGRGPRGLRKLPGSKEKTCWVCTVRGKDYNKSRKKSRTVCTWCNEGCHPQCLVKHTCK